MTAPRTGARRARPLKADAAGEAATKAPPARRRRRTTAAAADGDGRPADGAPAGTDVDVVDLVEQARDGVRATARAMLGITGRADAPPLRRSIKESGASWYPLLALSALVFVDRFQSYGFFVLGPEVSRALGVSTGQLAGMLALKTVALTLASLPMAAYVQKRPRRGAVSVATAFAWSVLTVATGGVVGAGTLLLILVADGASTGSAESVHTPLLLDSYPPSARVRALAVYNAALSAGNVGAPLIVALAVGPLGLTWRGAFIMLGVVCLASAFFAARLRDPGFGHFDVDRVRDAVAEGADTTVGAIDDEAQLRFFEIVRRVMMVPTIRRVLAAAAVLGMMIVPLYTFLFFFLDQRWGMGPGARALFFAVMPVFSIAALSRFGPRGESLFAEDPARLVRQGALFIAGGAVLLAVAIFTPWFLVMVVLFGTALAMLAVVTPILGIATLSIVPPRMRPHAAALIGIFLSAVGGFSGLVLLGGMDRRFGTAGAIASLAVPGVIAGLVLRSASTTINADLDRMLDEVVEETELRILAGRGAHVPMLSCRHIDFSYGQLQVLFNVDFTVDEGEMVALLGTNGAGKSTLLRVVSGVGFPTTGSVRFRGTDITYLDAERRVGFGIVQVPGGRAVFGPMTVVENLRLSGYAHGRDRRAVEAGIEASFDAFPRLAERRNQPASTLSGGEQQMLGLARALVLRPKLLCIDELSLGLAPRVVSELLVMVRRINEAGTAVVLVEQSVNIALSLVDHAYFMEKGEIRFDGPARELLERGDLLRSVFLAGAKGGLA